MPLPAPRRKASATHRPLSLCGVPGPPLQRFLHRYAPPHVPGDQPPVPPPPPLPPDWEALRAWHPPATLAPSCNPLEEGPAPGNGPAGRLSAFVAAPIYMGQDVVGVLTLADTAHNAFAPNA